MATSLYACGVAQADEHTSATVSPSVPEATAPAEAPGVAVETPDAAPEPEETPNSMPAVGPTNGAAIPGAEQGAGAAQEQPAPPGRPSIESPPGGGRPAVIRGAGTGEERRATQAAVALNEIARPADRIDVRVRELKTVESQGEVPGYRYGPSVVVVVTVHNRTDAPISTMGSDVTVEYGESRKPADPSPQAGDSHLPTEIAAGATATGTYTFLVPADGRDDLAVTVSYRSTDPAVVLEGPARLIGQNR